jgi:hypothetical protein
MQTHNNSHNSEVARLVAQICTEYEAAQRGMYSLREGSARHQFINAKMERIGTLKNELAEHIGDAAEAMTMIVEALSEEEKGCDEA